MTNVCLEVVKMPVHTSRLTDWGSLREISINSINGKPFWTTDAVRLRTAARKRTIKYNRAKV